MKTSTLYRKIAMPTIVLTGIIYYTATQMANSANVTQGNPWTGQAYTADQLAMLNDLYFNPVFALSVIGFCVAPAVATVVTAVMASTGLLKN